MSILTMVASLLLLGPVSLESGKFTITQSGKKIGSKEFTLSARHGGGYVMEAKTQLSGGTSGALSSRMELDERLNPIAYQYSDNKGSIRVKVDQPASEYET